MQIKDFDQQLPKKLLLSFTKVNRPFILRGSLPFALLASLLGFYVGWQATPMQ